MTYKTCLANVMATRFMMMNYPDTLNMAQEDVCRFFADKDANKDEKDLTVIDEFAQFAEYRFLEFSPSDQLMAMNFLFGYNNEFLAIQNKTVLNLYEYANAKEMITSLKALEATPKSSTITSYIVDNKVGLLSIASMSSHIDSCANKVALTPYIEAKKIILSIDGSSESKTAKNPKAKPRNIENAIDKARARLDSIRDEEIKSAMEDLDSQYLDYCILKISDRNTPESIVGNIPAYVMLYKALDTLEEYSVNDLKKVGQRAFEDNTARSINNKKFNNVIQKMNDRIFSRSLVAVDIILGKEVQGSPRHLHTI